MSMCRVFAFFSTLALKIFVVSSELKMYKYTIKEENKNVKRKRGLAKGS